MMTATKMKNSRTKTALKRASAAGMKGRPILTAAELHGYLLKRGLISYVILSNPSPAKKTPKKEGSKKERIKNVIENT